MFKVNLGRLWQIQRAYSLQFTITMFTVNCTIPPFFLTLPGPVIYDLVHLCLWVLARVIAESDPLTPPGAVQVVEGNQGQQVFQLIQFTCVEAV